MPKKGEISLKVDACSDEDPDSTNSPSPGPGTAEVPQFALPINLKVPGARWRYLRTNRKRIIEVGKNELLHGHRLSLFASAERRLSSTSGIIESITQKDNNASGKEAANSASANAITSRELTNQDLVLYNLTNAADDAVNPIMHSALPFLPVPSAVICCLLNILLPGTGTILSGMFLVCCGRPRLRNRQSPVACSLVINFMVGITQLCTVTFLLVGWFWSITWGAKILNYSLQYRRVLQDSRKEAVAAVAIEALTHDTILHRTQMLKLVTKRGST